jgi:uncharacterized membrane protein
LKAYRPWWLPVRAPCPPGVPDSRIQRAAGLPAPGVLVSITGVLELAGAVGLLLPRTMPWAAAGLAALLVAMVPANVYAAGEGLTISGAPAMALVPRALLQLLFLAATLAVLSAHIRSRRLTQARPEATVAAAQR